MPIKPYDLDGLSPLDRFALTVERAENRPDPLETPSSPAPESPGYAQSTILSFKLNSIIGNAATDAIPYHLTKWTIPSEQDSQWDVLKYATSEWLNDHPWMIDSFLDGTADDFPNEERFRFFEQRQHRDWADRETLGRAGLGKQLSTSLIAQIPDIVSGGAILRGVDLAGRAAAFAEWTHEGSLGARVLKSAVTRGGLNLAQEEALHALNPNRHVDEGQAALWATGMGLAFGGAVPVLMAGKGKVGGIVSTARIERMQKNVAESLASPKIAEMLEQVKSDKQALQELLDAPEAATGSVHSTDFDAVGADTSRSITVLRHADTLGLIEKVKAKYGDRIEIHDHPMQAYADWSDALAKSDAGLNDKRPADLGPIAGRMAKILSRGIPATLLEVPGQKMMNAPSSVARKAGRLLFDFAWPTQETIDRPVTNLNRTPAEGLLWQMEAARDRALIAIDDELRAGVKEGPINYRMAGGEEVSITSRMFGRRKFFRAVTDHLWQLEEARRGVRETPKAPPAVEKAAQAVIEYARHMGGEALDAGLLKTLDPNRIYLTRRWLTEQIRRNPTDFKRRLLKAWHRNREVDFETSAPIEPGSRPILDEAVDFKREGQTGGKGLTPADREAIRGMKPQGAESGLTESAVRDALGEDTFRRYLEEVDLYLDGEADSTIRTMLDLENSHGVEDSINAGVFKNRKLQINETDFADYLDKDVGSTIAHYDRQVSGRIASRGAIKRAIDEWEPLVKSITGKSLTEHDYDPALVIEAVKRHYQDMIDAAQGDAPLQSQLRKAMDATVGEKHGILIHKLAELERRPVFAGNDAATVGWKLFAERNAPRMVYMAALGKMTLSAIPDLAAGVFYNHLSPRHLSTMGEAMLLFREVPLRRHLEGLYVATSDMVRGLRATELGGVADLPDPQRFGPGAFNHGLARVDAGMDWLTSRFTSLTGMNRWNTNLKRSYSTIIMDEVIQGSRKMAKAADLVAGGMDEAAAIHKAGLSAADASRLNRLGLNGDRSKRLMAILQEHGVDWEGNQPWREKGIAPRDIKNLLDSSPAEPMRHPRLDGNDVQAVAKAFEKELVGKTIRTPLGKSVTIKIGHFFKLVSEGKAKTKGFVAKAGSPLEAQSMLLSGKLQASDINGFRPDRASDVLLVGQVLESPDLILRQQKSFEGARVSHVFVKRFERSGKKNYLVITTDEAGDMLGLQHFSGRSQLTNEFLKSGNVVYARPEMVEGGPAEANPPHTSSIGTKAGGVKGNPIVTPFDDFKGYLSPEFNKWFKQDRDLFDTFTHAVNTEVMNLIVEPKLMSKPLINAGFWGRAFNQFQSFAYAWGNQFAPLAAQRPGYQILQYATLATGLGGLADALHNHLSGRRGFEDTMDLWREKPYGMLYAGINRAGLVGWLSRPLGLLEQTPYGIAKNLGNDQMSTMYGRPQELVEQAGPMFSWLNKLYKIGQNAANGQWDERTSRQLWNALPYHNLWILEAFNRQAENMGYDTPIGPQPKPYRPNQP